MILLGIFLNTFFKYYTLLAKIKILIINWHKPFFNHPLKNKLEPYEKVVEISWNDDYTTGNLPSNLL